MVTEDVRYILVRKHDRKHVIVEFWFQEPGITDRTGSTPKTSTFRILNVKSSGAMMETIRQTLGLFVAMMDGGLFESPDIQLYSVEIRSRINRSPASSWPVTILDLGVRAGNLVEATKVYSVQDLINIGETRLRDDFRNFGEAAIQEIKEKLAKYDLSLGE